MKTNDKKFAEQWAATATCVYLVPRGDAMDMDQIGAQGMKMECGSLNLKDE